MSGPKKTSAYRFDFNAEVARARRNYPEETKDIVFIDLAEPGAKGKIKAAFLDGIKNKLDLSRTDKKTTDAAHALIDQEAEKYALKGSRCYTIHTTHVLQLDTLELETYTGDNDLDAFFGFAHELGHLLVKGAKPGAEGITQECEIRADSFFALYGLKYSILNEKDILNLSLDRMWRGLLGDEEHLTSEALDHLVISMGQADFMSLTPKDIQKISQAHGKKFYRPEKELRSISKTFEKFARKNISLMKDYWDDTARMYPQKTLYDIMLTSKPLCTALAAHFSAAKYKSARCGELEKYIAKKVVSALKRA